MGYFTSHGTDKKDVQRLVSHPKDKYDQHMHGRTHARTYVRTHARMEKACSPIDVHTCTIRVIFSSISKIGIVKYTFSKRILG